MKRLFISLIVVAGLASFVARADGPDDQYVKIYQLIQEADQLGGAGQSNLAHEKYQQAHDDLKKLQNSHPAWNQNVVQFRLNYVAQKLGRSAKDKAAPVTETPLLEKPAQPGQPIAVGDKDQQFRRLTETIQRLQQQNAVLEEKLKEALAARPAAVDPRELAKAEERIRELEKEKELLRVSLEQEKTKQTSPAATAELESLKKAFAEAQQKLTQQTEIATALAREKEILDTRLQSARREIDGARELRAENEALKKKLTEWGAGVPAVVKSDRPEVTSPSPGAPTNAVELARLHLALKTLQEEKAALEKAKNDLEAKLAAASTPLSESERVRRVEGERDELLKKLNDTSRQLYDNKARTESVQREQHDSQLAILRARLEVFEARSIPLTAEELALFKPPQVAAAKVDPRAGKRPVREMPRGAAPLLAEAEHAFAARRFDEAEKKYREVLRLDEKNVFTLGNLAASQLEQNRFDEAEAQLKRALEYDPNDAHCVRLLGILNFRRDKFDLALDALSRAAQLDPQNPETQNYLGVTLSQKGQRRPAETALRKAIQLAPGYGGAHHNLAVVYATQQPPFTELARWHYQKALALGHPQNADLEKLIEGGPKPPEVK